MQNVNAGDEIVVSIMEHHSNILPWQFVCEKKNATLKFMYVDKETGEIPESEFEKITPKTKIVSITHVSNVLGTTNPVRKIADIAHKHDLKVIEDCAQAHGTTWRGKKVGSIGDIGCWSFYPTKNLGGFGDGGAFCVCLQDFGLSLTFCTEYL